MQLFSFVKARWSILILVVVLVALGAIIFGLRKESSQIEPQTPPPSPTPSATPSPGNIVFEPNAEWKPVDMSDLNVKAGSALDWEGIVPRNSAIPLPRLVIGSSGHLEAGGVPGKPIRLMGTGENTPWVMGHAQKDPQWKATWKNEAIQARRQGYDLIRLWADSLVSEDCNITPEVLDKLDYFIASMGEEGVYTFLTIGSYGLFLKNAWGPLLEGQRRDYPLRMFLGDPEIRKAWKYGAETLMNHVNAYTGLAWKDDPRIACVELFNEQEWGFYQSLSRRNPQTWREFDAKFQGWLEKKYQTPAALAAAWGESSLTAFSQVKVPENLPGQGSSARDNDYILFCGELMHENAKWMRETLRTTGYRGITAQYNISAWLAGQAARWSESQVTVANTYHHHPTAFANSGSKLNMESSVADAGGYWRTIASMRFADRPFIATEYNHPFWNPYQYEGGILFGAYSALQGLDGLMVHESAVFSYAERRPGLGIFSVGNSPTLRANQFLLGCLYRREDVRPSPHRVELIIPENYLKTDGMGVRLVSRTQNKIALMTGFSVAFPWSKPADGVGTPPAPDWTLSPLGAGNFQSAGGGWAITANEPSNSPAFSLDAAVAHMKTAGILPASNLSDPSKGIFQSDTGQILMRTRENLLKVTTPCSEAVTLQAGKSERVGKLKVIETSIPALIAACAVDREELVRSKRIVLIYACETANTGTETSPDRTTLIDLGKPPVLMKTGTLSATLENIHAGQMALYALGIDGSRREKLPLKVYDQTLALSIDTSALKNGPTPFFELIAE